MACLVGSVGKQGHTAMACLVGSVGKQTQKYRKPASVTALHCDSEFSCECDSSLNKLVCVFSASIVNEPITLWSV